MKRNNPSALIPIMAGLFIIICLLPYGCGKKSGGPRPMPEVAVVVMQTRQVTTTTELSGRTSAHRISEVRPQVGGIVQKRLFQEGSNVKFGQILYQIDPAPYQAAVDNAGAGLARSEATLPSIRLKAERLRDLLSDHAVSRQDYDDAAAALKQAEADIRYWKATLDAAQINLQDTRVTAPISGKIGRSGVTEGALVSAQQPAALATIQQIDPIYVDMTQSTDDLLRLRRHTKEGRLIQTATRRKKVTIILDDGTTYPREGTLEFQEVTVDPTTGSVILRALFKNPDGVLMPGMYVRAIVQEGVHPHALLIPQQGVSRDHKGNPLALIVDASDTVQLRPLKLDRAIGDQWLVDSGLETGDRVIVEGMQKVRPGMKVKAVPFEKTAQTPGNFQSPSTPEQKH